MQITILLTEVINEKEYLAFLGLLYIILYFVYRIVKGERAFKESRNTYSSYYRYDQNKLKKESRH